MAGGLRDEHGGPYVGGLWVFEKALPHFQVLM
jgi:hypothetical protein